MLINFTEQKQFNRKLEKKKQNKNQTTGASLEID